MIYVVISIFKISLFLRTDPVDSCACCATVRPPLQNVLYKTGIDFAIASEKLASWSRTNEEKNVTLSFIYP